MFGSRSPGLRPQPISEEESFHDGRPCPRCESDKGRGHDPRLPEGLRRRKRSEGHAADATDVHPEAIAFLAGMPAGLARMIYWPAPDGGIMWALEAKSSKRWKRFTEHHYHAS